MHSAAPETVSKGTTFQIKCDYGAANIPCIGAYHGTQQCIYAKFEGTTAIFNCKATTEGTIKNTCGIYPRTENKEYCDIPAATITNAPSTTVTKEKVCTPGQLKPCKDAYTAIQCNAEGTIWNEVPCPLGCKQNRGNSCNSVCDPSKPAVCENGKIKKCKADGEGWTYQECPNGCNAATVKCNECKPQEIVCTDKLNNYYKKCKADGTAWDNNLKCASGTICAKKDGKDGCFSAYCQEGIRVPGSKTYEQACIDAGFTMCKEGSFWAWFTTHKADCSARPPSYGGTAICCKPA
jgi:hypothetical protein